MPRRINIQFDYLEVRDILLKGKDSLVEVAPIVYKDMIIHFTTGDFSRIKTSLGSIFDLKLNTDSFNLDSCLFFFNQARLFQFRPSEVNTKYYQLAVTIKNTKFIKNNGDEALLYIGANSVVLIQGSIFFENFSLGWGSIIFSEKKNSVALIQASTF